MTNASALPVQRQVLEQLFITDPKVGFGHAFYWEFDTVISYITHKTQSLSLILMLLALPTFRSHLYNPYLTLKQITIRNLMKVVLNLSKPFITDFTNSVDEFVTICCIHYYCTWESQHSNYVGTALHPPFSTTGSHC